MRIKTDSVTDAVIETENIDSFLSTINLTPIVSKQDTRIVQLRNLRLVEIQIIGKGRYSIQEITNAVRCPGIWDISLASIQNQIRVLEASNDEYFVVRWHIDDLLSHNKNLKFKEAKEILLLAIEQHDPRIGITWNVLSNIANKVVRK